MDEALKGRITASPEPRHGVEAWGNGMLGWLPPISF
jgi:hypothetical protein